ncbi:twitching motility protein PilT [Spirochaetia bacterium]|nr:twitching motility protein PilT [Spirochaetia bacterium]
MTVYSLDTNIISYFLRKDSRIINKIDTILMRNDRIIISNIVYYEIRRGLLSNFAPRKTATFNQFCNVHEVGTTDKETTEIAASVYSKLQKKGELIEDADILIASFCLRNDFIFVTNNVQHFKNIDGLKIENWV